MGYILYSTLFLTLSLATAAYLTRATWLPLLPHLYARPGAVPPSFAADIESGLTSSTFDLLPNASGGDARAGLDDDAKRQIVDIMRGGWFRAPVGFDEARRIYMERVLERGGIGRDGRPRDPKFVSFS